MFQSVQRDADGQPWGRAMVAARPAPRWTVVIPFYNEAGFLEATLASLSAQTLRPFRVVLIDNGSTDRSPQIARAWARAQFGIEAVVVTEPQPGQVHALNRGLRLVTTQFVAVCDADTLYPPHYLAHGDALFAASHDGIVALLAHDAPADAQATGAQLRRLAYSYVIPAVLKNQAHAGGYAHLFRTQALAAAGGYDAALWPYVVKDHELIHRVLKQGALRYHPALWCQPSARRSDRAAVRWTLTERIVYHATPFVLKDWFFYRFLARRLQARRQTDVVLRNQPWGAPVPA